jgi:hypothetical protein
MTDWSSSSDIGAAARRSATLGDTAVSVIWIILAIILVGSSLTLRRLPKGNLLRLILIWVVIIAGLWLAVRFVTGMA